jgi:CHASE3 domain sensor protein
LHCKELLPLRGFHLRGRPSEQQSVRSLVVLIAGTTVFFATGQVRNANAARDRSRDILAQLEAFLIGMLNQETGVRGYLITGCRTSLEPYQEGRPAFERVIAGLRGTIGSSEEQRRLLDQAESSAREWKKTIGEIISAAPEDGDRSSALELERSGAGKQYFDAFRTNLSAIRVREQESFDQQTVKRRPILALAQIWCKSDCTDQASLQKINLRPAVHLAFDQL